MTNRSWEQTAEQPLDVLAEQYRAELERLNYGRATINVYLRTIRKLGQLIGSHDLPLDQLTPDIAPFGPTIPTRSPRMTRTEKFRTTK